MKCRYCGHEIPEGMIYCPACGNEVRIVPDYNPLDDVLAAQVKGSIDGTGAPLDEMDSDDVYRTVTGMTKVGRNQRASGGTEAIRRPPVKKEPSAEQRKRQAEKKKAIRKKRRNRKILLTFVMLLIFVVGGILLYQNSYIGQMRKGTQAFQNKEYKEAERCFKKAIKKSPAKPDAYTALSKIYVKQNKLTKAENIFYQAITQFPENSVLYEALIQFYIDTKQTEQIPIVMDDSSDTIRGKLSKYVVEPPEFSLEDKEVFDEVQELSFTTQEDEIYYTLDGSDPCLSDTRMKYEEPILIGEGETVVKAIAVRKKIPSLARTRTYQVEFPIEDAPAVSPSTGQYESPTQITIDVPEGYTAYYTMDKSNPTTDSQAYSGPIDMPEGSTIFKAVLVNSKGRKSGITTRNYEYVKEKE